MYNSVDEFWSEYLSFMYQDKLGGPEYVFRGVTDTTYQLISSLGRGIENNVGGDPGWVENKLMGEFKRLSAPLLKSTDMPESDFEWLFLAQHYGLPTRLLDWSTNPLVALYFATEKDDEKDGAVYTVKRMITDQYELFSPLTADYTDERKDDPVSIFALQPDQGKVIFIRPKYSDSRHSNQQSIFSCPANPFAPLQLNGIRKFEFKGEWKFELRRRLRTMGISTSFIYPGLAGIAAEAKAFYHTPIQDGRMQVISTFARATIPKP